VNCKEVRRNLSAYADGELAPETAEEVRAHLNACTDCTAELDFHKRLSKVSSDAFAKTPFNDNLVNAAFSRITERRVVAVRSSVFRRIALAAASVLAVVSIIFLASLYVGETGRVPAALAVGVSESALVRNAGSSAWRQLGLGDRLYSGDVVKNASGDSIALETPRGSKLVLNRNTSVQVGADLPTASFEIISGELFAEVNKEPFQVQADGTTVKVHGTSFSVRKAFDKTVVTVVEGVVSCRSARKEVKVTAGQQTVVNTGFAPAKPVSVDSRKELSWVLGKAEPAAEPVTAKPVPITQTQPPRPIATDPGVNLDQPLEPPKEKDKDKDKDKKK
jgi:ferric-dicitrate binding protein FerR (iron transport regulator)